MPTSFFIEHHRHGLAFYINGDLQFDTTDEAIYHEHLVGPTIALAGQRFPQTPLRVLICGGGDGLAARDALKFSQVGEIVLVDYSPEVLELGKTTFRPYNRDSLIEANQGGRVKVQTQEAFEFVSSLPDACFHAVICDFTFPTSPADTHVYSREWFQQVKRVLVAGGVVSTNGMSPMHRTLGFWCLYQTMLAADFFAKPMQICIPSFQRHGYSNWGFFLGSDRPIYRAELETIALPIEFQLPSDWLQAFQFPSELAAQRQSAAIHTLESPQLYYYLLNPTPLDTTRTGSGVNFLDIQEAGTDLVSPQNLLEIDAIVQRWLEQLRQSQQDTAPLNSDSLLPVQHRYHTPKMTQEWLGYSQSFLSEIEGDRLLTALLKRARELPPRLSEELLQLREKLRSGQPLTYVSEHTAELVTVLMVTLLMANLSTPEAVFAKGYSGGGTYIDSSGNSSGDGNFGQIGFWTMLIGGVWLWNLSKRRD